MVQVKGVVVVSIKNFVKNNFPDKYDIFLESLPPESKKIFETSRILQWYDIETALKIPTKIVCDKFFFGSKKGAWEMGKQSAQFSLKGVYKIFVKVGSPGFVISRTSRIFSTYYNPSEIVLSELNKNKAIVSIKSFDGIDEYIEYRIGGWMEAALEINGAKNPQVKITQSLAKGEPQTTFVLSWE